ncbi:MAG: matrixin family metalloprotease [Acidimicrobiia bacterium]
MPIPKCVRLHIAVLAEPDVSIDQMVESATTVLSHAGITLVHASTFVLEDNPLADLSIGDCSARASLTDDHRELLSIRDSAASDEIVVFFVRTTTPPLDGCALHMDFPAAIVTRFAPILTLAHELGHILGLEHADDINRLMYRSASRINPPPTVTDDEQKTMKRSRWALACEERTHA